VQTGILVFSAAVHDAIPDSRLQFTVFANAAPIQHTSDAWTARSLAVCSAAVSDRVTALFVAFRAQCKADSSFARLCASLFALHVAGELKGLFGAVACLSGWLLMKFTYSEAAFDLVFL
jgi:hypothetical protein